MGSTEGDAASAEAYTALLGWRGVPPSSQDGVAISFPQPYLLQAAAHRQRGSQNPLSQPSSNLRIFRWGRELRWGWCDGCDDCDGIFDTAPAVILIVTTVTNRHTVFLAKLMKLPLRVRFTEYSMPCSFSKSPALTFSLRVRILGCISSCKSATSSVALPFHVGLSSVITAAILSSRGSGGLFQSTQRCAGRSNER